MSELEIAQIKQKNQNNIIISLAILAAAGFGGYLIWDNYFSGFNQETIEKAKSEIRREFDKQENVSVNDVQLYKDPNNKGRLIGFAKINYNTPDSYIGGFRVNGVNIDTTKSCTATMLENNNYIWECR